MKIISIKIVNGISCIPFIIVLDEGKAFLLSSVIIFGNIDIADLAFLFEKLSQVLC